MDQQERKLYYEGLRNVITESAKYNGTDIAAISLLKIVHFDSVSFNRIKIDLEGENIDALLNSNYESNDGLDQAELIVIKDVNGDNYFIVLVDPANLWSDKYLYAAFEISDQEYSKLAASSMGHWEYQKLGK